MKKLFLILNSLFLIFNSFSQSPNWQWARAFAGMYDDRGYSIVTDVNGNIYSTGYFQGICDFDPGPGIYNLTSASGNDVYILKLNNSGNLVWVKQLNGMGYE